MFTCICVMHGHGLGKILFNIILYLRLGLPSDLLPSGFTTKIPHAYLFPPYAPNAPAISLFFIWSPE